MNLVFTHGKMEECTKDFIRKTKNMVMVFILGQIKRNMQAGGVTVNSMAWVFLFLKKGRKS